MKNISRSLVVIAGVAALAIGGTIAYFSDTETSTGNTFTAGTIDIAVDGHNPWSKTNHYALNDMKPSYTDYIEFTVKNVGTNPANLYKKLDEFSFADNLTPESEIAGNDAIDKVINYDMRVELYDTSSNLKWWETIYIDGDDVTLDSLEGKNMYLGMIPKDWSMKVIQSYHMISTAGNEFQGDKMTFNMTLTAEQLGTQGHALRLENKESVNNDVSHTLLADTIGADLTYKVKDKQFVYSLTGQVQDVSTQYSLIVYPEAFSSPSGSGWPGPVVVIDTMMSDGSGNFSVANKSIELGQSLKNIKVWLVRSDNLTAGNNLNSWNYTHWLFETGLMDYYDADIE